MGGNDTVISIYRMVHSLRPRRPNRSGYDPETATKMIRKWLQKDDLPVLGALA